MGNDICIPAYDLAGNLWLAFNAVTNTYTANALNQYTSISNFVPFVPSCEINPIYDADGNMLTNGVWSYSWDAENRLAAVYSNGTLLVSNIYDDQSRRIRKVTAQGTRTFLYDGWNVLRETVGTSTNYYCWGLDLSGTLQGAGGVGGLLAVYTVNAGTTSTYYPCYDANGNVTDYLDAAGNIRAHYEYSPFGEIIAQSGDLADTFTHRFSTKPFDAETSLVMYQFRPYAPGLGRWMSRDPIGERGGLNEYGFVGNDPANGRDYLGLWKKGDTIDGGRRRVYIRQSGDTLEGLATLLKLDLNEIHKWARIHSDGKTDDGKTPCEVTVPNVIVVFTSKPSWHDLPVSVVSSYRRTAESLSVSYANSGYKVIFAKHSDSVSEFKALWKTSGIYGFIYAGHGTYPLGFEINRSFDGVVFPSEVSPPHKLGLGMFYACNSDNRGTGDYSSLGAWKDHIAVDSGAVYLGYHGLAWWWSDPNTENMGK